MRIHSATIALAFGLVFVLAAGADAQQIHPRCTSMKDKVGCTCALQNGGSIEPTPGGGWRWYHRRGGQSVNEGYIQCMKRHGRS